VLCVVVMVLNEARAVPVALAALVFLCLGHRVT